MNYKKYLILFLSIFILIACKKLSVDDIQKQVDKKIYYDALYLMNEKFEKSTPSKEDLDRYQKIYNDEGLISLETIKEIMEKYL